MLFIRNSFLLFLCTATLLITACSKPQAPVFIKMENLEIEDIRNNEVFLKGDAVFHNPNPIAGKLVKTDIDVIVNEINVGKIKQDLTAEIEANSEFSVPVNVNFPFNKITKNSKGLLKGLVNALLDQKADVKYQGSITINFLKINFDTPIDYEEEISLK